jgi:hypothetical protein
MSEHTDRYDENSFYRHAIRGAHAASMRGLRDEDALVEGWKPFIGDELLPAIVTLYQMGAAHDVATIAQSIAADPRYAEFRDPEKFKILVALTVPVLDAVREVDAL